jgi:hypothetical protein
MLGYRAGVEVFVSNFLNDRQMRPVHKVGRDRDDILERTTNGAQDGFDIPKALVRLSPHVTRTDNLFAFVPGHLSREMDDFPRMLNNAHAKPALSGPPRAARIEAIAHSVPSLPAVSTTTYPEIRTRAGSWPELMR